jgi:hypothetical protein
MDLLHCQDQKTGFPNAARRLYTQIDDSLSRKKVRENNNIRTARIAHGA